MDANARQQYRLAAAVQPSRIAFPGLFDASGKVIPLFLHSLSFTLSIHLCLGLGNASTQGSSALQGVSLHGHPVYDQATRQATIAAEGLSK